MKEIATVRHSSQHDQAEKICFPISRFGYGGTV